MNRASNDPIDDALARLRGDGRRERTGPYGRYGRSPRRAERQLIRLRTLSGGGRGTGQSCRDGDGTAFIDELLHVVSASLEGCAVATSTP